MRAPFCQFLRDDKGNFDYHEFHAIECGIGDALRPCKSDKAWRLHKKDWHYYVMARGITTIVVVVGLILLTRSLL